MSLIKKVTQVPVKGTPVTTFYFLGIPVKKNIVIVEEMSLVHRISRLEKIVDEKSLAIANMDIRIINLEYQVRELESVSSSQCPAPKEG